MFGFVGKKRSLEEFDNPIQRDRLIQACRLVVIDDEVPELVTQLKEAGFAVDHFRNCDDLRNVEAQLYDVAIVDYHGVGTKYGSHQGLDVMKHIRRVSPRTRIIAYTSKSLDASESDFFRLSHTVLPKDMGLSDSLAAIEAELQKAMSKVHLFEALISQLNIMNADEKSRIKVALVKSLQKNDSSVLNKIITAIVGEVGKKAAAVVVGKLLPVF